MELDELKAAWGELNDRVTQNRNLLLEMRRESKLERVRKSLALVWLFPIPSLLLDILLVTLTGSFLWDGPHQARFLIPGLFLHLFIVASLGTNVWQILALAQVDYTEPTLTIQRKLARIQAVRLWVNRTILVLVPLLWTPLMIVIPQALVGLDVYRAFGWPYVMSNLVFGVVAIPILLYLDRRFNGFLGTFGDDIAGRKLAAAMGFLDEIARFEQE